MPANDDNFVLNDDKFVNNVVLNDFDDRCPNHDDSAAVTEVLYVGSGPSALKIADFRDGRTVVTVNNAYRLRGEGDFWLHSGDFPNAKNVEVPKELTVSYPEYSSAAKQICLHLGIQTVSPEHYVGYTIFFQGLHWVAWAFRPCRILLLGFDHDYNKAKVEEWNRLGRPNPQNRFAGMQGRSADEVFADFKPDAFYGHGTPDPMRLPSEYFTDLFPRAEKTLSLLGCEVFNASGVTDGLTPFEQYADR